MALKYVATNDGHSQCMTWLETGAANTLNVGMVWVNVTPGYRSGLTADSDVKTDRRDHRSLLWLQRTGELTGESHKVFCW